MRKIHPIAAVLTGLPGLALAWTPYGPGPAFDGAAPYGYPEPYAYPAPYSVPFYGPMGAGYPNVPGAVAEPPSVPAVRSAPSAPEARGIPEYGVARTLPLWPRLEITRGVRDDAYVVDILLQNIDPNAVEILPAGRGLVIRYGTEHRVEREDQLPGGGYGSRYSLSRGTASRQVGLPGDADLAAMSTEIRDGVIQVRIPRAAVPNGGWMAPSARP